MKNIFLLLFLTILTFDCLNAQQLKVADGYLIVNNTALVLKGMDLVNNGTVESEDGTVQFSGTTTNAITGDNAVALDTLSLNKLGGDLTLAQAISVKGQVNLESGKVVLNDETMQLLDGATINGGNSDNYIQTNGSGVLSQPVADGDVIFPVGNSSYNPIILNNSGGTADDYTVKVSDELLEDGDSGNPITQYAVNRTWKVTESTTGGSNLAMTLLWAAADEIGTTGSNYLMANYFGGWNDVGATYSGTNMGLNSMTANDLSDVGSFGVFEYQSPILATYACDENGALTVDIPTSNASTFHAQTDLTADQLIESTASVVFTAGNSINLEAGFEVAAGAYFHAFIATCEFSALSEVAVERTVNTPTPSTSSLQLKVYPNPFQNQTNIQFLLPEKSAAQLLISDLQGKIIYTKTYEATFSDWQQTTFDAGNLPSGAYFLCIRSNGQQVVKQLLVQR